MHGLSGIFSLASAAVHAAYAGYKYATYVLGLAALFSPIGGIPESEDLRARRRIIDTARARRTGSHAWRRARVEMRRAGRAFSETAHDFWERQKVGWRHTVQALRGVPREQWNPPAPVLDLKSGLNPVGLAFGIGFMLLAGHAAARRAEAEGRDPRWAAAAGALGSGLTMVAQQIVFGPSLAGGIVAFGAYMGFYGGRELALAIKHGARYRESYVRATAAPWSFSSEPSDVAYQMMLMATQNTLGYQTAMGMEAAPAAARYRR